MAAIRCLEIYEIPDFLTDYTLQGSSDLERLENHWRRWTTAVGSLWHDKNSTYLLCYAWIPGDRLRIFFVTDSEAAPILSVFLKSFGITATEKEYLPDPLIQVLQEHCFASTISQDEALVSVERIGKAKREDRSGNDISIFSSSFPSDFVVESSGSQPSSIRSIYELRPFWGPGDAFLLPFNVIATMNTPVVICTLLRPYKVDSNVRSIISAVSRECETAAHQQFSARTVHGQQLAMSKLTLSDPQLEWCARLYASNLRRLSYPFMLLTVCFSCDAAACQQVANTIANSIREERCYDIPLGEDTYMPSFAQVLHFDWTVEKDNNLIRLLKQSIKDRNLSEHVLKEIPSSVLSENRKKVDSGLPAILRFIVDARGASALFRLPVSTGSGIPGIGVRQRAPDFHHVPAVNLAHEATISLGNSFSGGEICVILRDLTKHVLIVGTTGSGKTVTALGLLHSLWRNHRIPFLVIESAKQEYRGLVTVEELRQDDLPPIQVYTVGNEICSPIRINPFELIEGVRVEAHISRLQTCFEAALPQDWGSLASILAEALYSVYSAFGWKDTDVYCSGDPRSFPMMVDFVDAIEEVINQRYTGEWQANARGVLLGRLKPFLMGSKRRTFNVERSMPSFDALFDHPVILEMNDLNLDEKALVTLFLLTFLREYCEQKRGASPELKHVTLVEEAHNVLEQVGSVGSGQGVGKADTRYKAVQTFCQMLAEIRAYGEGLIIVDQSPVKLARDAMRNTNIQIAHLLRDAYDREAIASAMIMDEVQSEFIGKLRTGEAAVFYPGLEKATFVRISPYYVGLGRGFAHNLSDAQVRDHMRQIGRLVPEPTEPPYPHNGCQLCQSVCRYRKHAESIVTQHQTSIGSLALNTEDGWRSLISTVREADGGATRLKRDLVWCVLVHKYKDRGLAPTVEQRKYLSRLLGSSYE